MFLEENNAGLGLAAFLIGGLSGIALLAMFGGIAGTIALPFAATMIYVAHKREQRVDEIIEITNDRRNHIGLPYPDKKELPPLYDGSALFVLTGAALFVGYFVFLKLYEHAGSLGSGGGSIIGAGIAWGLIAAIMFIHGMDRMRAAAAKEATVTWHAQYLESQEQRGIAAFEGFRTLARYIRAGTPEEVDTLAQNLAAGAAHTEQLLTDQRHMNAMSWCYTVEARYNYVAHTFDPLTAEAWWTLSYGQPTRNARSAVLQTLEARLSA